jgi:tetratricopeptide (TPR) repeat protein
MNDTTLRDTPYKGLIPYDEDDEQFFFGREPEREMIIANLMASRLTLLYGPSGVGKSSVLRAGVAADLRKDSGENLTAKGIPRFVIVIFNDWKDDPLTGLLNQIRQAVKQSFNGTPFKPVLANLSFADELAEWADRVGGKLLIVLDQFEDYFLYPQTESFAVEFPRAVNRPELRANFLISIREDWLAKLDRFKVDLPKLFDNYLRIDALKREAARTAIEQPVARYNEFRKTNEPEVVVLRGFSDSVLDQLEALANKNVLGESGSGQVKGDRKSNALNSRIQPPYLQLVMIHLWKNAVADARHQLDPQMLSDPDTAEKIIQSHLEEVMKKLDTDDREAAARVFHHLVTPSGRKIAQSLSDLADYANLAKSQIKPMLDRLSSKETGILSQLAPAPGQPNDTRYEIFHDVLAPAVLHWCKQYLTDKDLHAAQLRAEQEGENARRQARTAARLRRLSAALAVITLLAIIFALFGGYQYIRAQQKEQDLGRAQKKIDRTQAAADSAIALSITKEQEANNAIAQSQIAFSAAAETTTRSQEIQQLAEAEKDRANRMTVEAREAQKNADLYGRIGELYQQGFSLDRELKYDKATSKYLELSELCEQARNSTLQADALIHAGEAASKSPALLTEALKHYKDALSLTRQAPTRNSKEEAAILMSIGNLYSSDNHVQESLDSYIDAATVYQRMNDDDGLGKAIDAVESLANYTPVLDSDKELASRLRLLTIYRNNKDRQREFGTLIRIGQIYFNLNRQKDALDNYRLASELAPQDVQTLKIIGDIYYQLNKKQEALRYYEKAIPIFDLPPHYKGEIEYAIILASIGDLYRQLNKKEKALQVYSQLQEQSPYKCAALKKIADLYGEQNEKEMALNLYLLMVTTDAQDAYCFGQSSLPGQFSGPALGATWPLSRDAEIEVLTTIASLYKDLGNVRESKKYNDLAEERKKNPF